MKLTPAGVFSTYSDGKDRRAMDFAGKEITHVDDISSCLGLAKLDLSKNRLRHGESLSGIRYCKSLTWLNLAHNQLADISVLGEMKSLTGTLNASVFSILCPCAHASLEFVP